MTLRLAAAALACALTASLCACSTIPEDEDPAQVRTNEIDARLARVEKVVANQSLLTLSNDVESLRNEVKSLRNEVDQLTRNLEAARQQQRDQYSDLDSRLKVIEGRPGGGLGSSTPGVSAAPALPPRAVTPITSNDGVVPGDGTDRGDYAAAISLLKNSQYDRAIAGFRKFLATYPDSPLAENAQYWLGEAYYVSRSYPDALQAFHQVSERYPQSAKLPDALLKTGFCYYELKQWPKAREILTQVAQQYPDATAGRLARQRLDKMTSEHR